MARRLKFSVVGLPHYTIWHLYEPSVDDLRHMEEMEKEKKEKEAKAKAEKQKIDKIKSQFDNPAKDWEKDKATFQILANADKKDKAAKKKEEKRDEQPQSEISKKIDEK